MKTAYLVKGDDPSLVSEMVHRLITTLLGDADPSMALEDMGDEGEIGGIVAACATPPFFDEHKVVVARSMGRFDSDGVQPLLDWLDDPLPSTRLILTGGGGALSQKLVNRIKKVGEVVEAEPAAKERVTWLLARVKEAGLKLDAAAGKLIVDHLGEDLGRLQGLLASLAAAYGESTPIGADEVAPFLGVPGAVAPWDLTDAIDGGDIHSALDLLHRMMKAGERHALVVIATLHRHFQAMLRLDGAGVRDEREAAALVGMAPYPAKKAMTQGRKLGSAKVLRGMRLIAAADLDVRGLRDWKVTEEPDGMLEMEVLVARLAQLSPPPKAMARR
ncbi:MAG TPA: DNA polymerase III subunit delta [Acidimicrobiales bacterium]|nr:DNA polymerase III subunit delta [Acidimicrobiales bacterium]